MMRTFAIAAGLILGALACPSTALADGDTPYMATVAIDRAAGSTGALGEAVVSTLHVDDPKQAAASLAHIDGLQVTATDDGTVSILSSARPTLGGAPADRHRNSSWVLDFDEVAIQELVERIESAGGNAPSPAELEHFVFGHITNKTYSRAFDLASRVAATGEGDCTEHAVLLAALARAHGYPARMVLGNIVLELDDELLAFGHAWTEIYADDRWQIYDATMPGTDVSLRQARYIPAGDLHDEGPAYFMALVERMLTMPKRISDVGSPP